MAAGVVALLVASWAWADATPPRLKYRAKGPVCSCASGLGEAEISRARAGLDRLQGAESDDPAGASKDTEQQRRSKADDEGK